MFREREARMGVRPGSEPAHTSSVIGYTTQRDAILSGTTACVFVRVRERHALKIIT